MDKYERGYKKSCNVKKIRYKGKIYKVDVKALNKFIAQSSIALILAGAAVISVAGLAKDSMEEAKNMRQTKSEYVQLLDDNTHRTYDNQGYWYDYSSIAKGLLQDPEDFDLQLYCIHEQIGYNEASKKRCTNELFGEINFEISKDMEKYKDFNIYETFDEYLEVNGYMSEDEYEDAMEEKLEARMNSKEGSTSWKK